ncbi:MAG: VOC family protein [Gemmatimonadetes bacterium]|nr:VOC family protein [Gemmatimonadota bacterium]
MSEIPAAPEPLLGASPATFFTISVADLGAMVAFYRDVLGFAVHMEGTIPGREIGFALLTSGRAMIELLRFPNSDAPVAPLAGTGGAPSARGLFKAGWVVENVDAVYAALAARGVAFWFPLMKPEGGPYRAFGLKDPEGNLLQLFGV